MGTEEENKARAASKLTVKSEWKLVSDRPAGQTAPANPLVVAAQWAAKQDLVRRTYWRDDSRCFVNGSTPCVGGGNAEFAPMYNPICIAGPQMSKKIMRRLISMMPLSDYRAALSATKPAWRVVA